MSLDVTKVRKDFPILEQKINNKALVYFDSAASSLKPRSVVDRISNHYMYEASNVHRGLHYLSNQATSNFESVRKKVKSFLNASSENEIVFTKGMTEAANLVAQSFVKNIVSETKNTILVPTSEHHSNIVPWQIVDKNFEIEIKEIPINEKGDIVLDEYKKLLNENVVLVALSAMSNSTGAIHPMKLMIEEAHKNNIPVFVDAAQSVPHLKQDVKDLDCDFLAFSSHKLFGPTGLGVLYTKAKHYSQMMPYQGGGSMIDKVTLKKTTYLEPPFCFEAGTPHIAGVIGLGAALDYLSQYSWEDIILHEEQLTEYAENQLSLVKHLKIIGTPEKRGPIISFVVDGIHHLDIASALDNEGIAVRSGHHCTQPLMEKYNIAGTVRVSFSIFNTFDEIDHLKKSLEKIVDLFLDEGDL